MVERGACGRPELYASPLQKWKFPSTGSRSHSHPSPNTDPCRNVNARPAGRDMATRKQERHHGAHHLFHRRGCMGEGPGGRRGSSLLRPRTVLRTGADVSPGSLPVPCTERWSDGSDNGTQNGSSVRTTTAGSPSTLQSNSRCVHRGLRWTRLDRGGSPAPVVG